MAPDQFAMAGIHHDCAKKRPEYSPIGRTILLRGISVGFFYRSPVHHFMAVAVSHRGAEPIHE